MFDLKNLTWSTMKLNTEATTVKVKDGTQLDVFPATAGHSVVCYCSELLYLSAGLLF